MRKNIDKYPPLYINFDYYFYKDCFYLSEGFASQNFSSKYKFNPDEVLLDYFIFDIKKFTLENPSEIKDDFERVFKELVINRKDKVKVEKNGYSIKIKDKKTEKTILESKDGQIKYLDLMNTKELKDDFLVEDKGLKYFIGNKLEYIGSYCLNYNTEITSIRLPNLERFHWKFLEDNSKLKSIDLPKLTFLPSYSFVCANSLQYINLPNLKHTQDDEFIEKNILNNKKLKYLNLPLPGLATDVLSRVIASEQLPLPKWTNNIINDIVNFKQR